MALNIRSLYPKIEQIFCLLEETKADILCLSETWLTKKIHTNHLRYNNYNFFRLDRSTPKKGGGLCIYLNSKLKHRTEKYIKYETTSINLEVQILEILLPCTRPIVLMNNYRPPSGKIPEAIQEFQSIINNLESNIELYVKGDLNIDYNMNSASYKKLTTFETRNNLLQYITSYTRITRNSATLVDHAYTNSQNITESGVIDLNMSDHYAIYI